MSSNLLITQGSKTLLDNTYPTWKCDVRPNPKHFGLVRVKVNRLTAFTPNKTIFSMDHNYGYTPSYIVAWNYPRGTAASGSTRQTFGIGILSVTSPVSYEYDYQVDSKSFRIVVSGGLLDITDDYAEFRYLIFAEDFPLKASSSNFFA